MASLTSDPQVARGPLKRKRKPWIDELLDELERLGIGNPGDRKKFEAQVEQMKRKARKEKPR